MGQLKNVQLLGMVVILAGLSSLASLGLFLKEQFGDTQADIAGALDSSQLVGRAEFEERLRSLAASQRAGVSRPLEANVKGGAESLAPLCTELARAVSVQRDFLASLEKGLGPRLTASDLRLLQRHRFELELGLDRIEVIKNILSAASAAGVSMREANYRDADENGD